jgi:hypothetical protein
MVKLPELALDTQHSQINLWPKQFDLSHYHRMIKPNRYHFVKPKSSRLINKIARFLQESFKNLAN